MSLSSDSPLPLYSSISSPLPMTAKEYQGVYGIVLTPFQEEHEDENTQRVFQKCQEQTISVSSSSSKKRHVAQLQTHQSRTVKKVDKAKDHLLLSSQFPSYELYSQDLSSSQKKGVSKKHASVVLQRI